MALRGTHLHRGTVEEVVASQALGDHSRQHGGKSRLERRMRVGFGIQAKEQVIDAAAAAAAAVTAAAAATTAAAVTVATAAAAVAVTAEAAATAAARAHHLRKLCEARRPLGGGLVVRRGAHLDR